jgi:CheY-like chemotaxis protein
MPAEIMPSDQMTIERSRHRASGASEMRDRDMSTVLVVEDNPDVRLVAEDLLKLLGYRVICVEHGSDALVVLESDQQVDLLFTDMVLPGDLNGRKLMEVALEVRPNIKMLGTSGYAEETLASESALPVGILLLPKPYKMKELAAAIEHALAFEESLVA